MKVLVLYSHPVESSYGSALHVQVIDSLARAGHQVDDCDLYAEKFDPVMSREDRMIYHSVPENRERIEPYLQRLEGAEAMVIVSPVWNFGFPAMLKGYFDRVWVPGVCFDLIDGRLVTKLHNITKLTAVMTYGADPFRAFLAGNPPRKVVTRMLRANIKPFARVKFMAHYQMDRSTPDSRAKFLTQVKSEMERF